jgi:hypothetical protein
MKRQIKSAALLAVAVAVSADTASAAIVITEIHYNPNGGETASQEWIEIFNTGDAAVDLSGWDWGDSQDVMFTGNFPDGTSLARGAAAILVAQSPATFQQIWGSGIQVIQADTGISLGNTGSATNETVVVRDATDAIIDAVNYETSTNGWPGNNNQASIYLTPVEISQAGNDIGANWALSVPGVDGAFQAQALNPEITNATLMDIASPGVVAVPEPASVATVCLAGGFILRRNRRRSYRL